MSVKNLQSPSCLKALDGNHLQWAEYRSEVLSAYNIKYTEITSLADHLPTTLISFLQTQLEDTTRFNDQKETWRRELAAGRGFNFSPIFPPHLLPPVKSAINVQRLITPRISRESLPLRTPGGRQSIYELPTPSPQLAIGFPAEAFENFESNMQACGLSVTGVFVDYENTKVTPGKLIYCPFLFFEKANGNQDQDIEKANNRCAIAGSLCLRGQQRLFYGTPGSKTSSQPLRAFTCAINNNTAVANYHFMDEDGSFAMAPLCRFDLDNDQHFNSFQTWIESIEQWAVSELLTPVQTALQDVTNKMKEASPVSPALSMTLSIDTQADPASNVLSALRSTYPLQKWGWENADDTPILSSVAQCGTPLRTRRMRSHMLSPATPDSVLGFTTQDASKIMQPLEIQTGWRSPYQPHRPSALSPMRSSTWTTSSYLSSPCRPPSLSPCTPPPDAPGSARNQVLVLRRRLEVASDEVSELRDQVETLQSELQRKTSKWENQLLTMMKFQEEQQRREKQKMLEATQRSENSPLKKLKLLKERWMQTTQSIWTNDSRSVAIFAFVLLLMCTYDVLSLLAVCFNISIETVRTQHPQVVAHHVQTSYMTCRQHTRNFTRTRLPQLLDRIKLR